MLFTLAYDYSMDKMSTLVMSCAYKDIDVLNSLGHRLTLVYSADTGKENGKTNFTKNYIRVSTYGWT